MKTESEKKAQKKYIAKIRATTKKQLNITINKYDDILISSYAEKISMSKTAFIVAACKYCIENNIELSPELPIEDDKQP